MSARHHRSRFAQIAFALLIFGLLAAAPGANAHPLGNFTVNHLDVVRVSSDRIDVRYILDQAEIPTFQERAESLAEILASKQAEARRGLRLRVNGATVTLHPAPAPGRIVKLPGQGGLPTTRVELLLTAHANGVRTVALNDSTYADRIGWRAMIAVPGQGTRTQSSLPAREPTSRLRRYPRALLSSPADQRSISLQVSPGHGTLQAPQANAQGPSGTTTNRAGDGLAGVFDQAAAGKGALVFLLFAAFGWGALHALSPGHGKAMVAAYLVGAKGTPRHAVILGATVTVTHTIGVFTLGFITLALSQYLLPEDLYPWLNLTAGLLVLIVGACVLRARLRGVPEGHHHDHNSDHHHDHHDHSAVGHHHHRDGSDTGHEHQPVLALAFGASANTAGGADVHGLNAPPAHKEMPGVLDTHRHTRTQALASTPTPVIPIATGDAHTHHAHFQDHAQRADHDHSHAYGAAVDHGHSHGHRHHHEPASLTPRALLAAGASAGLIPCPSALVVLLGAIAQQQIALGLLLIVVFSLGLAATLTAVGLLVVSARGFTNRLKPTNRIARAAALAPAMSAVVIVAVGLVLTIRAVPLVV